MINIILNGCNGRMGQVVAKTAASDPEVAIVAGVDKFPDAINNPFPTCGALAQCADISADVIIDFSRPEALPSILDYAKEHHLAVVIATTGMNDENRAAIARVADEIAVFTSSNMSLGVNVLIDLARKAASVLGNAFDIEIIEKHHNQKEDAPSGTALSIAEAINEVLLDRKRFTYGRYGTSAKRSADEIGIHAIRGGTMAGEHSVILAGHDEVLELTHTAQSRDIFAVGALNAAKFIVNKPAGLYNMVDLMLEKSAVTNLYVSNEEAMITLNAIPHSARIIADVFNSLADKHINVDMISQTTPVEGLVNISFTIPETDLNNAINAMSRFKKQSDSFRIDVFGGISKLTIEGSGMERQPGIAAKIFDVLAQDDIRIKLITTSETKISCVIDREQEETAMTLLRRAFNL